MEFLSKKHFEILKGIAIVLVVISHAGNFSGVTWFTPLGGIGVAIFLFCSGYSHTYSQATVGLKDYWKKKLLGVYFPYFIIELFFSLILRRGFSAIVLDLLLIKPAHAYSWYMQYLFGCYFLFWLVFKFIHHEKACMSVFAILASASFFVFTNLRAEQALSFIGGIVVATLIKKKDFRFRHGTSVAILLAVLSVTLLAIKQFPVVRQQDPHLITLLNLLMKSSAAASIVYLTYAVDFIRKASATIFPFWGRISYVLYLTHGYFIFIVERNLLNGFLIDTAVFIVVATAVAVIVSPITQKMTAGLTRIFGIK